MKVVDIKVNLNGKKYENISIFLPASVEDVKNTLMNYYGTKFQRFCISLPSKDDKKALLPPASNLSSINGYECICTTSSSDPKENNKGF
jgi:hypothetical protein